MKTTPWLAALVVAWMGANAVADPIQPPFVIPCRLVTPSAPSLLVLIPAYNEEHRIGPVLAGYAEHFIRHYPGRFQLVVILNGCYDNTLEVVRAAEQRYLCIGHLDFPAAIGKGGALIEGLKLAPQDQLLNNNLKISKKGLGQN